MGERTIQFYVNYRKFHGGHLKLRDYYDHVQQTPGFRARVCFSARTVWDELSPWTSERDKHAPPTGAAIAAHLVSGVAWAQLDEFGPVPPAVPILNLVQHVRHADPGNARHQYLSRRAIRVCVSDEVAVALRASGEASGPIVAIPNGVPSFAPPPVVPRDIDLLIVAVKQPKLGAALAEALTAPARRLVLLDQVLPREDFLAHLQRARVTLFLPNPTEGFYLPALEGMLLDTLVICPDVIGNRSFCRPGETALMPAYDEPALIAAATAALTMAEAARAAMLAGARRMASCHTLDAERTSFQHVLRHLDEIWRQ